jgi:hypothetical protein
VLTDDGGREGGAVIDPDVVALLESGCATFVGTVDADGAPAAAYGMGALLSADGSELRLVMSADEDQVLDNLRTTGVVAIGATDVFTLRSVQVKGRALRVEPITPEDRIRTERYLAVYFDRIHQTDGTPVDLIRRMTPREYAAFVMTVDELYDQTPGPQAGMALGRS